MTMEKEFVPSPSDFQIPKWVTTVFKRIPRRNSLFRNLFLNALSRQLLYCTVCPNYTKMVSFYHQQFVSNCVESYQQSSQPTSFTKAPTQLKIPLIFFINYEAKSPQKFSRVSFDIFNCFRLILDQQLKTILKNNANLSDISQSNSSHYYIYACFKAISNSTTIPTHTLGSSIFPFLAEIFMSQLEYKLLSCTLTLLTSMCTSEKVHKYFLNLERYLQTTGYLPRTPQVFMLRKQIQFWIGNRKPVKFVRSR